MDIVQFKPLDLKEPTILVGLPDVGLVGTIAVSYIINKLGMKEAGYIDSPRFPPLIIIKESAVKNPVRIYCMDDIVAIISDLPFIQPVINPFFRSVISWVKTLRPKAVIGLTGLPSQERLQVDKPEVSGIATTSDAREMLDRAGVRLLTDGVFIGVYAGLLKECNIQRVPNITLFAQSHMNFPDPVASLETLAVLNRILDIYIDLKQLQEEAEGIKLSTRELMRLTEEAIRETQTRGRQQAIYR
jgi:uncharacterized protein